ncbi:hypothetical protein CERSUDRAFT_81090 [Gelatoporia subvermispora B]|uniref:Uncharacterized protein n=1 Tax=Ceriporiopsis subvermispora (strain B) TaxID=914234 RepID=M2PSR0_CERS8|nr:hypothetical protein CERSUDRAFT_81090 [Gelatoporia subvermispora B]
MVYAHVNRVEGTHRSPQSVPKVPRRISSAHSEVSHHRTQGLAPSDVTSLLAAAGRPATSASPTSMPDQGPGATLAETCTCGCNSRPN